MSEFEVRRTITINAPAGVVFERLADFKRWTEWSPWENVDANLVREYSDPSGGVGAHYGWSGNRKAGQGTMTITGLSEPSEVNVDLQFLKPIKALNKVTFTLTESDGTTAVIWSMRGVNDTLAKRMFAKAFNMDKVVGGDFEKGLAALKAGSEAQATTTAG
jgi:Polyketide cyclase / dehydrase and lipid transport